MELRNCQAKLINNVQKLKSQKKTITYDIEAGPGDLPAAAVVVVELKKKITKRTKDKEKSRTILPLRRRIRLLMSSLPALLLHGSGPLRSCEKKLETKKKTTTTLFLFQLTIGLLRATLRTTNLLRIPLLS